MDDPGFRTVFPLDPEASAAFEAALADPPPANARLRNLVDVKARLLAHPEVAAEYERQMPYFHRRPEKVRVDARAWRAKQRAADIAPLSDKVVYPRRLVDAPPPPKKGRGK